MLKKPISKVLKPHSGNNTTSHEKPLLRPLQSQKSEGDEQSKKSKFPIVRNNILIIKLLSTKLSKI